MGKVKEKLAKIRQRIYKITFYVLLNYQVIYMVTMIKNKYINHEII